ncbi:MAG: sodium-dependent transporter [Planctomycetota bacterium]|jgi:SNF family Na+-dependent transporter
MSTTDYAPPPSRERWGSRVGLILAMAGNAVGLGNFLRFPNQAAANGGGSFMLAYFVSLLLLGIPLMWMEWGLGRRGGSFGFSTCPGMFQSLTRRRWARYAGALGVVMPLIIVIYYVYIESWTLGFAVQSLTGQMTGADPGQHFGEYLGADTGFLGNATWQGSGQAYLFFLITIAVNLWVLSRGLTKGIETAAKIGMPILFLAAVALVARTLTLPDVDGRTVTDGLAIYWKPDIGSLLSPGAASIWLAAAGQIFFTLSVGSGAINTYASYLTEDDDIALTGLATVSTNEFCEVILGGTLAIPAAYLYFGMEGVTEFSSSNMGLAFVAMPKIFANAALPGVEAGPTSLAILGTLWFGLLFLAGITSSLALSQPAMAFMQDTMGLTRRKAAAVVGALILVFVQPVILLPGVLDEMDYWAGTFGLVLFSALEAILLMWVFGSDKAWAEIHKGADIRIPRLFKFIMTFVTPLVLLFMLGWWGWEQALPILRMEKSPSGTAYTPDMLESLQGNVWLARGLMLALALFFIILVAVASRRGHFRRLEEDR